ESYVGIAQPVFRTRFGRAEQSDAGIRRLLLGHISFLSGVEALQLPGLDGNAARALSIRPARADERTGGGVGGALCGASAAPATRLEFGNAGAAGQVPVEHLQEQLWPHGSI